MIGITHEKIVPTQIFPKRNDHSTGQHIGSGSDLAIRIPEEEMHKAQRDRIRHPSERDRIGSVQDTWGAASHSPDDRWSLESIVPDAAQAGFSL
jgi:hypothetical protein